MDRDSGSSRHATIGYGFLVLSLESNLSLEQETGRNDNAPDF